MNGGSVGVQFSSDSSRTKQPWEENTPLCCDPLSHACGRRGRLFARHAMAIEGRALAMLAHAMVPMQLGVFFFAFRGSHDKVNWQP